MKLATTTGDFAQYAATWEECVQWIHDAGFRYIDFGGAGDRAFVRDDGWQDRAKRLNDYAQNLGMQFVQMHSPDGINPLDPVRQDELVAMTNRSIEVCAVMGISQTVVHPGTWPGMTKEEFFKENRAFFSRLFPSMEKTGVNVLVENTTRKNVPPDTYDLFTGEDMAEFLRYVNHPLLHAVWDTGHGNVDGPQYENIVALGKELYGLHIHDNNGWADEHSIPYFGTLSLDGLMHGLLDVGYQGYFTFEAIRALEYKNGQAPRYKFEGDRRLRHPTAELQMAAEKLLYAIGKHCLTAYDVFEG
ncbi:MAG: sugar phosphate isomerase/epimerase [Oscillospiraceae bacterium]|nr:sugar phosphate isomerase/epimerase [Oscillospiraceae bacterium]